MGVPAFLASLQWPSDNIPLREFPTGSCGSGSGHVFIIPEATSSKVLSWMDLTVDIMDHDDYSSLSVPFVPIRDRMPDWMDWQ